MSNKPCNDFAIFFQEAEPEQKAWAVWRRLVLLGETSTIEPKAFIEAIGHHSEDPKGWLEERFNKLSYTWFKISHGKDYSYLPMIEACTWDNKTLTFKVKLTPKIRGLKPNNKHA